MNQRDGEASQYLLSGIKTNAVVGALSVGEVLMDRSVPHLLEHGKLVPPDCPLVGRLGSLLALLLTARRKDRLANVNGVTEG